MTLASSSSRSASFKPSNNIYRLQDRRCLCRRQRVGECRRRTVETQVLLHGAALAGDEAAIGGECLGKASHHDVDLAEHVLQADMAAAFLAEAAEIMRHV